MLGLVCINNLGSKGQPLGFDSWLQLLLAVRSWASDVASRSLSFLLGKNDTSLIELLWL